MDVHVLRSGTRGDGERLTRTTCPSDFSIQMACLIAIQRRDLGDGVMQMFRRYDLDTIMAKSNGV